jgi:hypothetical protein
MHWWGYAHTKVVLRACGAMQPWACSWGISKFHAAGAATHDLVTLKVLVASNVQF